ncbi:RNA-guided endonuclease InsQ/TnpB family protein [Streptomyces sp. HC307]|uniref:RNA-guided endonuclease InsQ/TnpB family protein n=1 Tax=Streptomyces flavusporus TaxID=3385496 RepID=UPI00391719DC
MVQVRLPPTPVQAAALEATLRACNEAATWASEVAFDKDVKRNFALREHTYGEVKARWRLGAQAAQHVIKKTCDAYATLKVNRKAGNLGKPGSQRYRKAAGKPVAFRPQSAQPCDDRMLSWQIPDRRVSIWTVSGRVKDVAFTAAPEQLATLALYRKGESDLVCRDGMWFLNATCEVPEAPPNTEPVDFLGIDLGIVNIATTSDGEILAGRELNRIRERVRLAKPQRATLHSWSFAQLGAFIAYKARRVGVPVVYVDPAYTSRTCAECGHVDRANRVSQAWFACRNCGFVDHADRWGHLPLERSREWGRLPQHPRSRVGVVATRGPVNGPCPTSGAHARGGLDANAASHPVMPVVQARLFSDGQLRARPPA